MVCLVLVKWISIFPLPRQMQDLVKISQNLYVINRKWLTYLALRGAKTDKQQITVTGKVYLHIKEHESTRIMMLRTLQGVLKSSIFSLFFFKFQYSLYNLSSIYYCQPPWVERGVNTYIKENKWELKFEWAKVISSSLWALLNSQFVLQKHLLIGVSCH